MTRAEAFNRWFHGLNSEPPASPDVREAFIAGWTAREADMESVCIWACRQIGMGRTIVALVAPDQAPEGPRYAGFYCEDYKP